MPAAEAPAAFEEPSADATAKKRPLEEAPQNEAQEPAAKLAKVEPVAPAAPAAPPAPRVRKHMDHPAARAQRRARKAQAAPPEPEVLFPVGESPADVAIPRRLRTATPRRPRSSRAAWGRLKQVRGIGCQGGATACAMQSTVSPGHARHSSLPCWPTNWPPRLFSASLQAAHGTLPLGSKRSKNVFWAGAAEEAQPASSSSEDEEEEEER